MPKIYKEFNKSKHVIDLSPQLLAAAEQGKVLIATPVGYFSFKKVERKDGAEWEEVVIDED